MVWTGQPYLLLPFTSSVMILRICCVKCMGFCDLSVSAVLSTSKRSMMTVCETFPFHLCRNSVCALVTDVIAMERNYTCSNKTGKVRAA